MKEIRIDTPIAEVLDGLQIVLDESIATGERITIVDVHGLRCEATVERPRRTLREKQAEGSSSTLKLDPQTWNEPVAGRPAITPVIQPNPALSDPYAVIPDEALQDLNPEDQKKRRKLVEDAEKQLKRDRARAAKADKEAKAAAQQARKAAKKKAD